MRNGGICFHCDDDRNLSSLDFSDYPPQPLYETNICELCGNNAYFGYDCPLQVPFVYNQNLCFDQNFDNNFPLTSPDFSQQNLVYENCGGSYATFQCQPMDQNFSYSNSFGFDQYQPPQSFVTQQFPQRSNEDILLEMANLIKNNRILLNNNIFPHEETSMSVLLAKERILKLFQTWDEKQIKSWSLPELLLQLLNDSQNIDEMLKQHVRNINEELSEFTNSSSWDRPMIVDDEEHSIQFRLYLENSSKAIAPILPIEELEYSLNTLIDSSPKFYYLLKLAHINPIPPRIEEADFDLEEEIRLVENLSYDNSSPRPPEELNAEIVDTIVESLSISYSRIENDDYDSEGDIHFLEELFSNDPIPLPENESFNFDHYDEPSFLRPPPEPPDVEVFFDFEPNSGELISGVMNNIHELIEDECFNPGGGEIDVFENVKDDNYFPFIFVIQNFLSYLIYPEVSPLLLSTGSEDTIFDP
uniref:Reverse transcriptase domain-containing protein n=1 Tax=Tanacetum cinerariifolium TaxID=118510 RepID=A0A699H9E1_TANCI|nr:hypothetical protein [Tanacetum cinerariifolium]